MAGVSGRAEGTVHAWQRVLDGAWQAALFNLKPVRDECTSSRY